MRNRKVILYFISVGLCVFISSCSAELPPQANSGADYLQAWFDAPLPGSEFPVGGVQVLAHGADPNGVQEVELSLMDGQVIGSQTAGQGQTLVSAAFNWQAAQPGMYTLRARALNISGDWSAYAYTDVVIRGEEEQVEETSPTPETAQPTPTNTPTPEACTDLAAFVSETVEDDTVFAPGTSFTKTWTLRNAGSCTWTTRYALSFYDGDQLGGASSVPLHQEVAPGESITLSVNLTAPNQGGTYKGRWMMMNNQGQLFGLGEQGTVAFWVQIVVQTAGNQAPIVSASYAPNGRGEPTGRQRITFSAAASDSDGIALIEIYLRKQGLDWVLIGSCSNQSSCSVVAGPFPAGTYDLKVYATDTSGNEGHSSVITFVIYN